MLINLKHKIIYSVTKIYITSTLFRDVTSFIFSFNLIKGSTKSAFWKYKSGV